jgi:hypothetical protein
MKAPYVENSWLRRNHAHGYELVLTGAIGPLLTRGIYVILVDSCRSRWATGRYAMVKLQRARKPTMNGHPFMVEYPQSRVVLSREGLYDVASAESRNFILDTK